MKANKKLSVCIINKDEESCLPECIKNMQGTAYEIIVADLGTSGSIRGLAEQAGANVYRTEWQDDFSKIKNFCMDHATGEWVLFLSANEIIPRDQHEELKLLMLNPAAEGYLFDIGGKQEETVTCPAQSLRMLRNRNNYRFNYRSFEYIPDKELYSVLNSGITIKQIEGKADGWQREERTRLLRIDLEEHPQDGYLRYLEGIGFMNQGRYEESAGCFEIARYAFCGGYIYVPHLYKCLGISLMALSRQKEAEEVLSEGSWLFPFYTDLLVLRAQLYRKLEKDDDALNDLEICLKLRNTPNTFVPQAELGISEVIKIIEEIRAGNM